MCTYLVLLLRSSLCQKRLEYSIANRPTYSYDSMILVVLHWLPNLFIVSRTAGRVEDILRYLFSNSGSRGNKSRPCQLIPILGGTPRRLCPYTSYTKLCAPWSALHKWVFPAERPRTFFFQQKPLTRVFSRRNPVVATGFPQEFENFLNGKYPGIFHAEPVGRISSLQKPCTGLFGLSMARNMFATRGWATNMPRVSHHVQHCSHVDAFKVHAKPSTVSSVVRNRVLHNSP